MLQGRKVTVVLPAYNAQKTLAQTVLEIDRQVVDEILLVDDCSQDATCEVGRGLGIETLFHQRNLGYGGNQKTCYQAALARGADIVIMLHPDYQYTPKLVPAMAQMIAQGVYDCVLGSRILGGTALSGGMPRYKYVANRLLTLVQNLLLGQKVSEYHTGLRAFSRQVLEALALGECSDDFIFDNEMLAQIFHQGFRVGEISCPTKYFEDASSINFVRSAEYGLGVLRVSLVYRLNKLGVVSARLFRDGGRRLADVPSRAVVLESVLNAT